jgi:pimeloyl-ACP methyl ester carboxylesterase
MKQKTTAFFLSMLLTLLLSSVVSSQQKPTTGYAPVNGLKMYYEIHGSGEPVVLLHGAFMSISGDWNDRVGEFSREYAGSPPSVPYPGLADSPWATLWRPRVRGLNPQS